MSKHIPALYAALSQEQKNDVIASMKLYNGDSISEIFTDPETFFHQVYHPGVTQFHIIKGRV